MTFPDATAMAAAGTTLTSAYNAFPILASVLAIVLLMKYGPAIVRLVKRL